MTFYVIFYVNISYFIYIFFYNCIPSQIWPIYEEPGMVSQFFSSSEIIKFDQKYFISEINILNLLRFNSTHTVLSGHFDVIFPKTLYFCANQFLKAIVCKWSSYWLLSTLRFICEINTHEFKCTLNVYTINLLITCVVIKYISYKMHIMNISDETAFASNCIPQFLVTSEIVLLQEFRI